MRGSFADSKMERLCLPPVTVNSIAAVAAHTGRQEVFAQQSPQALQVLRVVAVVRCVGSSNRIEGVTASPERL